jgi:hypothetical protein
MDGGETRDRKRGGKPTGKRVKPGEQKWSRSDYNTGRVAFRGKGGKKRVEQVAQESGHRVFADANYLHQK